MSGLRFLSCVVLLLTLSRGECEPSTNHPVNGFPEGHPQRCVAMLGRTINIFEVLPGLGWDNLANEELGQTFDLQYKQCRLTEDGMYLIPDHVNVLPVKESNVGLFAELTESMTNYKSATSSSINGGVSASVGLPAEGFGVSGSFAAGTQKAKLHMYQEDSTTFISRVTARYDRYRVNVQPDMPLAPVLRNRILAIAESYQLNHKAQGRYLSEVLVRDFGTHVITGVEAGAMYTKEDFLTKKESESVNKISRDLKIGAGLAFSATFESEIGPVQVGGQFGIDYGDGGQNSKLTDYQNRLSHSTVTAYGGLPVGSSGSNGSWVASLDNQLVTTDRRGKPIQDFITSFAFPELPSSLVVDVQNGVKQAFTAYYRHNMYRGCTDHTASNFDVTANVDSGACNSREGDHLFGGVFQTCTKIETDAGDVCASYSHTNPITGNNTCPKGYSPTHLVSGNVHTTSSEQHCKGVWLWKKCKTTPKYSSGVYNAFWCAPDNSRDVEMKRYFGGIFTSRRPNDLTGNRSCPDDDYQAVTLGEDIQVCIGSSPLIGFGGMFSCQNGNRMALPPSQRLSQTRLPKSCPAKYSQRFITLIDDCSVEFCSNMAKPQHQGRLPALQRPPFVKQPYPNKEQTSGLHLILLNDEGDWFKNEKAYEKMSDLKGLESKMKTYKTSSESLDTLSVSWSGLTPSNTSGFTESLSLLSSVIDPNHHGEDGISTPIIAMIASLATIVCVVLTTVLGVACRRRYKRGTGLYKQVKPLAADQENGNGKVSEVDDTQINILIQPSSYGST